MSVVVVQAAKAGGSSFGIDSVEAKKSGVNGI